MDQRTLARFAAGLLSLGVATSSSAQVVDIPDFVAGLPTFAANLQEIGVAPQADGGFVVAWGEFGDTLGAGNRIVTHRFSRAGLPVSPPVRIDTSGYGLYPDLVADKAGGFVGSWMWSKVNVARGLYVRRLDGGGVGMGSEIRVDTPDTGPMVAGRGACRDSGCVYFWKQNGLFVRAYDRFGAALTAAVRVGDNTPAFEADIDTFPDGGFVVVWSNLWLADHSWARIYHADLSPAGEAFPIDTVGIVDEVVTDPVGGFAVVGHANWDATTGGDGGARGETWMRRLAADGSARGARVVVRTVGAAVLNQADAAYDSRGNLFVVWREYDQGANVLLPARARAYSASGLPLGPDFALTSGPAAEIQTTALADDCFASAWYVYGRASANVVCLCAGDGCGDGVLDPTCETCDDGNTISGDSCDANCTAPSCGNGVVAGDEQCDDGNAASGDGCDVNCTLTACGNGIVTDGEQCDDGNHVSDDGCDADCRPSGCGNGVAGAGEACDDGNTVSGDGCDVDCSVSACGNGIRGIDEACDDGNTASGDGCDADCSVSACGNGIAAGSEECDDGNRGDGDGCDRDCLVELCGNGRREGGEECDSGGAPAGLDGGCNADCTLRGAHDSVVLGLPAIEVSIPVGREPFPSNVVVQVKNADTSPERETPGHAIRLVASDGDCPPGTVTGQPDFDRGSAGVQESAVVAGGVPATAIAEVSVSRDAFAPFSHSIPERCTLWFTASEASGGSDDPTPDNNLIAVNLDVTDTEDPVRSGEDEFFVESMDPVTVKVAPGQVLATRQIRPVVRRSRDLPASVADVEVTVSVSDGDCPPGTVGYVDFDRRAVGAQPRLMLRRGRRAKGTLGLLVRAEAFDSPGDDAPRRCTALVTATGAGDTDPSNNTTRLVVDVIDRNDF